MADARSVERAFNDHAEVGVMRRFNTPETQQEAFEIRQRVRDLMDQATTYFHRAADKHQQRLERNLDPPLTSQIDARHAALVNAGNRYKHRTDRILAAGEIQLKRLDERQHQRQQGRSAPSDASVRLRAAAHIDKEHRYQHQALIQHHRHEEQGHLRIAKRQLASFDIKRAEDGQAQRPRSAEEKAERVLQARQLKLFRAANRDERQQHNRQHEQTRHHKIADRAQAIRRVEAREQKHERDLTRDFRQAQMKGTVAHSFNRHR